MSLRAAVLVLRRRGNLLVQGSLTALAYGESVGKDRFAMTSAVRGNKKAGICISAFCVLVCEFF
jgi:hypothetical protein